MKNSKFCIPLFSKFGWITKLESIRWLCFNGKLSKYDKILWIVFLFWPNTKEAVKFCRSIKIKNWWSWPLFELETVTFFSGAFWVKIELCQINCSILSSCHLSHHCIFKTLQLHSVFRYKKSRFPPLKLQRWLHCVERLESRFLGEILRSN